DSGTLARKVEERQRHDHGVDAPATALDGPLDGDLRARRGEGRRYRSEADRLLQDRAPAVAGELADLGRAGGPEHRNRRAIDTGRDRRWQAGTAERRFDPVP